MISQTAEYALRTMVWLASQAGEARTSRDVAAATQVPAGYLSKVLQTLGRAGLVTCQRGMRGGCRLARAADRISILDVVNAVDPIQRIERCPLGREHVGGELCPLHRRLDEAVARTEAAFASTPISALLKPQDSNSPLCRDELPGAGDDPRR